MHRYIQELAVSKAFQASTVLFFSVCENVLWCFFQKKNFATGGEIQGEEKNPHPLARYVHPPLVKP